jgi:hypothetical protein
VDAGRGRDTAGEAVAVSTGVILTRTLISCIVGDVFALKVAVNVASFRSAMATGAK